MVCISGFSGSGKDEFASRLKESVFAVQTGLADPGKRHMADVYGFTEQQLFGPSSFRNAGDLRYPKEAFHNLSLKPWVGSLPSKEDGLIGDLEKDKKYWFYDVRPSKNLSDSNTWTRPYIPLKLGNAHVFVPEADPQFWLSPREALQQYLEKMNNLYLDTWIRKGINDQLLIASGNYTYDRMLGLVRAGTNWTPQFKNVVTCFADFRHIHEVRYTRISSGVSSLVPFRPVLVRIKRPSVPVPPFKHRSETEQVQIRDAAFDFIIENNGTVDQLHRLADEVMSVSLQSDFKPKTWDDSYLIPTRKPEEGYAP